MPTNNQHTEAIHLAASDTTLEVLPHAGEVADDVDPERLQPCAAAQAGAFQDGGRAECARADEDEGACAREARGLVFGGPDERVGQELYAGRAAVSGEVAASESLDRGQQAVTAVAHSMVTLFIWYPVRISRLLNW